MASMNRRGLITGGAAAAAAWAFFSQRADAVPLNAGTVKFWFDEPLASHADKAKTAEANGYRTLSLSIHGDPAAPRYAAVMVKRPNPVDTKQFNDLSLDEINDRLAKLPKAQDPYWPIILSATGTGADARFAAVFSKMKTIGKVGMSRADLAAGADVAQTVGLLPWWVEAYGDPAEPLYTSVGLPNKPFAGWWAVSEQEAAIRGKTLADYEDTAFLQQRFDTVTPSGARPLRVAPTPGGGHYMIFTDTVIGPWECWGDMSLAQLEATNAQAVANGRFPFQIAASGSGATTRYAGVWTGRDDIDAKSFRAHATSPAPLVETAVEAFLKDHRLTGFQLAVLDGAKLIYAGGFNFAEADYPDITNDTRMRQASTSKIYTAAAIWVLIQQGDLTLDTTLEAVFANETLPESPSLATLGKITIRNLLESASGLPQNLVYGIGTPPFDVKDVIVAAADATLTGTPGETSAYAYGNLDYCLLSQVIRIKTGAASFEEALDTLVLQPMGMSRTRESVSLLAGQAADEALYHYRAFDTSGKNKLFPFDISANSKGAAPALVPYHYGGIDLELADGCGGLSSAVVDLARLMSIFNAASNPILTKPNVDKWLKAAKDGTAKFGGGAQHGFDSAAPDPNAGNFVKLSKGGWLPAAESLVQFYVDGYSMIAAKNGNSRLGSTINWIDTVGAAVLQSIALGQIGTDDLFGDFTGPALPQGPSMLKAPRRRKPMPRGREDLSRVRAAVVKDFAAALRRPVRTPRLAPGTRIGGRGGAARRRRPDDRPPKPPHR